MGFRKSRGAISEKDPVDICLAGYSILSDWWGVREVEFPQAAFGED